MTYTLVMEEPVTEVQTISTSIADNIFHENGILEVRLKPGIEIDAEGVKENFEATSKLIGDRKCAVLIDARVEFYTTNEARALSARYTSDHRIAEAAVINSLAGRLVGNSYINFNKPAAPARIFTSREEAMEWLKGFL